MNDRLENVLEILCRTADARRQADIDERHRRALAWEPVDRLPVVMSAPPDASGPFEPFPHREIFGDPEKMLFNELVCAFDTSIARSCEIEADLPLTIRANFGTVLVASVFGADVRQVGDNPPWVLHGERDDVSLEAVAAHDPQDVARGWIVRVEETYAAYLRILDAYPELRKLIRLVLPDLQGPFDNLELIVGSGVFEDLVLNEALVDRALDAVARTQVALARRLAPLLSDGPEGFAHQHATMIGGTVLLRNDSVIMMSPEMYRAQVAPHDARVFRELGGGGIHSCGRVERHIPAFLAVEGLRCFDFGQSELNDIDRLYVQAAELRVSLVRVAASEEELVTGRVLERFPTGVSLVFRAASRAEAARVMDAYRRVASVGRPSLNHQNVGLNFCERNRERIRV
jgi:hypothetical protein